MESNVVNMFAAQKVRLHGMKSAKWTTKDKVNQYRGLINLYTRDRKIIEFDSNVGKRKLQRELKDIQKSVYNDRHALDNAIRGDKQKLRNTLADRRELQLAFKNSQPKKVIVEVDQLNFNKRKVLDKLIYDKSMKSKKLIDLKLELALLEDRLKYSVLGQLRQESEAQIITGKVQDAILRKEAAWAIHQIYREILDIMKRDALYFDSIIATVRNDGYNQSKCFLGATKLGQLATEYLDDRKQEYDTLQTIVLKDLTTRKIDIKILNENVDNATADIKQMIRKESDITTCVVKLPDTASLEQLNKEVADVVRTLQYLKNATLVPTFQQIYPCLVEQKRQRKRLKRLAKKLEGSKDTLSNKANHAELMNTVLKTTMGDNVTEYRLKKQEITASLDKLTKKKQRMGDVLIKKRNIAANIRICLRQFLQLSYEVKSKNGITKKPSIGNNLNAHVKAHDASKKRVLPVDDETDGYKILQIILPKFSLLMQSYFSQHKEEEFDDSLQQFEAMMQERFIMKISEYEKDLSHNSLLEGIFTETSQTLTREDIKKQSDEIVAANTKNDDLIPMIVPPLKVQKKFNKDKKKK